MSRSEDPKILPAPFDLAKMSVRKEAPGRWKLDVQVTYRRPPNKHEQHVLGSALAAYELGIKLLEQMAWTPQVTREA